MRINWLWLRFRVVMAPRCHHVWMDGDNAGHKACEQCGVWRWFLLRPESA
jgi:predicted  nucleic acid-binding Zn-ribbon protein